MLRPELARSLTDARKQLHHAAQFATALGISYLERQPDDSHTNLGWSEELRALVSRPAVAGPRHIALCVWPEDLTLGVLDDGTLTSAIPLHGRTVAQAEKAIDDALTATGLDATRYTLQRHYEIPHHAVDDGAAFDATLAEHFRQLAAWYGSAARVLEGIARETAGASQVRTWPHHFDIATLVTVGPDRFTGAGLSPGDDYYGEPYFYVNVQPQPAPDRLTEPLDGGGAWHTHEWIGAVLPGSRLTSDATGQLAQMHAFLVSALAACRALAAG